MAINQKLKVDQSRVIIDPRTLSDIFWETITEYPSPIFVAALGMALLFLVPGAFLAVCAFVLYIKISFQSRPDVLPLHLPFFSKNKEDRNDPHVSGKGFNKPQGIGFLGYLLGSMEHVYVKFEALLRHIIVVGTTGAGKTETLLSIFANFLAFGSGGQYTDAKGTSKFWVQMFSMLRVFGREDDGFLINFNKGNTSERFDPADRITHTTAPFSFGSADSGIQLTNSLMPEDSGGSNKVFQESAVALISAVFPAMVDLRDVGLLQIDPKTIRKFTNYADYCWLMKHPLVSDASRQSMLGFIRTRSGYTENKPADKQPEEVYKQFGFAQAYFARCLQMLADTYGNIYMYGTGEIDFRDAILNDRIVCTVLPSMTKSSAELGSLGKLILSAKKSAYSIGLGIQVQGDVEDIVDSLPMATSRPIIDINDEYAFMAVKGYAITAAQCRGIYVVVCIAGQDWAGIRKADPDEAEQFWANSRIKYFMASEGDSETWPKIKEMASQVYTYVKRGMVNDENATLSTSYINDKSISLEKVDALQLSDLRKLNEGEGVLFFQEKMLFIRNFWHGMIRKDFTDKIRIFTRVRPIIAPKRGDYAALFENGNLALLTSTDLWLRNLETGDLDISNMQKSSRISTALDLIRGKKLDGMNAAEKGIAMMHGFMQSDSIQQSLMDEKLLGGSKGVLTNQSGNLGGAGILNQLSGGLLSNSESIDQDESVAHASAVIDDLFEAARKGNSISFDEMVRSFDEPPVETKATTSNPLASNTPAKPFSISSLRLSDEVEDPIDQANESITIRDTFDELGLNKLPDDLVSDDGESEDIFSSNFRQRIAYGTSKIEEALGTPTEIATQIGTMTADAVMQSTKYPQTTMDKTAESREKVRSIIDNWLDGPNKI